MVHRTEIAAKWFSSPHSIEETNLGLEILNPVLCPLIFFFPVVFCPHNFFFILIRETSCISKEKDFLHLEVALSVCMCNILSI